MRYKKDYAALPSTTHFTERAVKVSNYCSNISRSEERVSQFALCYNVVHDTNVRAKGEMVAAKKKKGKEYKNNSKVKARGKIKFHSIFLNVAQRHQQITSAIKQNERMGFVFNEIFEAAKYSGKKSFKAERLREKYEKNHSGDKAPKPPNAIERVTGFDITANMRNEVPFSKAVRRYEEGIVLELRARGISDEDLALLENENFTAKKNKLREMVAAERNISDVKEVKSFGVQSNFDWQPVFNKN